MYVPRPSRTLIAFSFAGALVGLLTMSAGLLIGYAEIGDSLAIECAPFPLELERQSSSEFRLTAPAAHAVQLDLDFLELDGDIIRTRQIQLAAGATTSFAMLTRYVGAAIQVIASAPVQVDATLIYDGSVGPPELRAVPCTSIKQPVRGWLYPPIALPL